MARRADEEMDAMKWIGYGLQGVGGMMAIAGLGVFAVGRFVEHVATGGTEDDWSEDPTDADVVVGVL
jgi:hypothetical protein